MLCKLKGVIDGIAFAIMTILLIAFLIAAAKENAEQYDYTDEEYCNAIWMAEGGNKTKYPYGIKSMECENAKQCRRICETTVRRNRKRYKQYGHREHDRFISFLAERFAPTRNVSGQEAKLNKNWRKNVEWFLENPESIFHVQ